MHEQLIVPGFEGLRAAIEAPKPRAARAVSLESQRAIVRDVLTKRGDLTAHEVASFCRLTAVEAGRRLPEVAAPALQAEGKVLKRKSPLGRASIVWTLA